MNISIVISRPEIFNDVYNITGHEGRASEDMDRISATEDEERLLSIMMKESIPELGVIFSSYGFASLNEDGVVVNLDMPSNWKNNKSAVERAVGDFIVNDICFRWYSIYNKELVKMYSDKKTINSEEISRFLNERSKPTRA